MAARRTKQPRREKSSAKRSLGIVYPEGQRFACRDCPARCCTYWGIPVSDEERERIFGDDEAMARLDDRGRAILRAGILPMRERNERLQCAFLDDDHLCSLHKRHGHAFLPAPCQAFPFGFSENEIGQPVALLSRYCPSIRDDYGEPVGDVIEERLGQAGIRPMADRMGLGSGRTLAKTEFAPVVEKWREILREGCSTSESLTSIYEFTDAFDEALPKKKDLSPQEIEGAIEKAMETSVEPLRPRGDLTYGAKMLIAHLLGGMCYPSRVLLAHRVKPISFWEKVRSWGNRLAWLLGWGRVKLLFVERPVAVGRIRKVAPFLGRELGRLVSDYLVEVLWRRQGMSRQTYLNRVIVDMALMTLLISRYARASAQAAGRTEVVAHDVKEGIGVAELLFSHQGDAAQSTVLHNLRLNLMSNPRAFRGVLASET